MGNIQKYCTILGVRPGSSADEVKRAFREKIKIHHPDSGSQDTEYAKEIIEAYNVLKNGVPIEKPVDRTQEDVARQNGYSGPDMRNNVFGGVRFGQRMERVFSEEIEKKVLRNGDRARQFHNGNVASVQKTQKAQLAALYRQASPQGRREYDVVEDYLKNIIRKYDRQKGNRPKKFWARDFVRDLNDVQIRFRSVANFNPSIAPVALHRLKEVGELMMHIKRMVQT